MRHASGFSWFVSNAIVFTAILLQGCDFKINSLFKKATIISDEDKSFKRPVYPENSIENGAPSLVLVGDLGVSKTNVQFSNGNMIGPVVDMMSDIRERWPTAAIVLVNGMTTYRTESNLADRQTVANNLANVMAKFSMISNNAAWGLDDPSNDAPNEGAARICAALSKTLSGSAAGEFDHGESQGAGSACRNQVQTKGHFTSVLALGSDYDIDHVRPIVMDTRAQPASQGNPSWKITNNASVIDQTTQLNFLCDQTFKNMHSSIYDLGQPWADANGGATHYYELPEALGSQRLSPLIMAGDPFSTNPLDFDPVAASYLKSFIASNELIPIVFVKSRTSAGSGSGSTRGGIGSIENGIEPPKSFMFGGRRKWVVYVGSIAPTQAGVPATYTIAYIGRQKAVVKYIEPLTGVETARFEMVLDTPVNSYWKNQAATSTHPARVGGFSACCRLDALMRPASSTSTTMRSVNLNDLITSPEGQDCGLIVPGN